MKSIGEIVAENIRQRRIRLGLSQAELAEKAKLNPVSVNRIENGKRKPAPESVEAIASALGCSEGDLYQAGVENKQKKDDFTAADAVAAIDRLIKIEPLHRRVVLAILFEDPTLVREDSPRVAELVSTLAEVL